MTVEQMILKERILEVAHPDMSNLSTTDQAQFAMVRRSGLGASDASVYMGVNQWTTLADLIAEKRSIGLTDKELEVGNKEVVRKGRDLEPIILRKFEETMDIVVVKPAPMYRLIAHPQLTINFDGVVAIGEQPIPVEAKFCSMYANKYWDRSKCIKALHEGKEYVWAGSNVQQHIIDVAAMYGIPPYYYTQIQQQMLGLNAPFGYFAVLFDKGWEFGAYKIFRDKLVQDTMIAESKKVWAKVRPTE